MTGAAAVMTAAARGAGLAAAAARSGGAVVAVDGVAAGVVVEVVAAPRVVAARAIQAAEASPRPDRCTGGTLSERTETNGGTLSERSESNGLTFFSLHPTRDVVVCLPKVALGDVQRAESWLSYPGGKALNGARTAGLLGGSPRAVVVAPTGWRSWLGRILSASRVTWKMLPVASEGRVCVILNEGRRETVINTDLKLVMTPRLYAALARSIRHTAARPGFLVLAGSLPPSLGPAKVRTLVTLARGGQAKLVLDQTGRWLREGIRHRPWLIKPNLREFHQLIGRTTSSIAQAMGAAEALLARGVGRVLLSLGERGCLLISPAGRWRAAALAPSATSVLSPVGCGDALLGAFLGRVAAGAAEPEALAWGVAAATANLVHPGAIQFAAGDVRPLVSRVRLTRA